MADNDTEKRIVISVDQQAAAAAQKAINNLEKGVQGLGSRLLNTGKLAKQTAAGTEDLNSSVRQLSASFDKQEQSIRGATAGLDDYEARLKQVKDSGANLSGDIASAVGGLRGASGALGLGGVTDVPLGIAEAVADLGEFLPKLKVGLEAVAKSGTGVVSTVASLAAGALPAAGAGFGAIAVAIAPIALTAAAIAAGLALVSAGLDAAAKAAAAQAEAQTQANHAVNEAVLTGQTSEQASQQAADAATQLAIAQADLADAQREYSEYLERRGLNALQGLGDALNVFGDEEQKLADAVADAEGRIRTYTTAQDEFNAAIEAGEFAANDTAAAEAELAETREAAALASIAQAQEAERLAEQSAQRVAQLQQQQADLINNRAIQEANANEIELAENRIAKRKEQEELAAHIDELSSIREAGAAKIELIEAEIAELPNQLATALAEVATKGSQQLAKLDSQFLAESLKATEDFNRESKRIAEDTHKAEIRLREDILDRLRSAVRDNDVVAFLEAQAEGQKELKRNAEDASSQEKRRVEDFLITQEEQRKAYQEQHAEILSNIASERDKVTQAFAERKTALEQQIQAERAATQQAIADTQARFAAQRQAEAQAAQDAAALQAIRDRQEQDAFNRQIANIQAKANAENSAFAAVSAGISRIVSQAQSMSASGKSASSFYSKAPGMTGSYQNPYTSSGFQKSSASNGMVNVNLTVGDVATGQMVVDAVNNSKSQIYNSVIGAFAGAS